MQLIRFENIDLSQYTYDLPEDRIAKYPSAKRDDSLLLVNSAGGSLHHDTFRNLAQYIEAGKHLVMNNSRVIPARLIFARPTGSRVELFCLVPVDPAGYDQSLGSSTGCTWECMAGNLKKFTDSHLELTMETESGRAVLRAEKLHQSGNLVKVRFSWQPEEYTFGQILQAVGKTPLPPYIKREAVAIDRERYQTVYAIHDGSVAAPTAGLHFTEKVMAELRNRQVAFHEVTLHVGAGTFQPIKAESVVDHVMHSEFIQAGKSFVQFMAENGNGVLAIGTTSVRTLESLYWIGVKLATQGRRDGTESHLGQWEAYHLPGNISNREAFTALATWMDSHDLPVFYSSTQLMIIPGYRFHTVDRLLTNFHQPGSTLLLLIAAFTGDSWKEIYKYALEHDFRFLSYGDSSLLSVVS